MDFCFSFQSGLTISVWPWWEDRGRQGDPSMHSEHYQSPVSVSPLSSRDGCNKLLNTSFPLIFYRKKNKGKATGIFWFSSSHFFLKIWMQLKVNNSFDSLIFFFFFKNSKFSLSLKALLLLICIFPRLSSHFPLLFWEQYTCPCNQRSMGNSGNIQLSINT